MVTRGERLTIYGRRLRSFWRTFRRNKAGITGLGILCFFGAIAVFTPLLGINEISIRDDAQKIGVRQFQKPSWISLFDPGVIQPYWAINDTFETGQEGWKLSVDGNGSSITTGAIAPGEGLQGSTGYKILYNHTDPTKDYGVTHIYLEKEWTHPYRSAVGVAFGFAARFQSFTSVGSNDIRFSINIVNPNGTATLMYPQFQFMEDPITQSTPWKYTPVGISTGSFYDEFLLHAFTGPGVYKMQFEVAIRNTNSNDTMSLAIYIDSPGLFLYGETYGVLGTDESSYDLFHEFLLGTRISFLVGIVATIAAVGIGLLVGLFSGYIGGYADELIMRSVDFILILPGLPLLIVLAYIFGQHGSISIWTIIFVIGILGWPGTARIVRSQVLSIKERSFVEASRAIGASSPHIVFKHVLPNVLGLVYALAAGSVGGAILTESALAFIGLGDPGVISWGNILQHAEQYGAAYSLSWWWIVPPGLGIALLSVSFIFIGHGLDEVFNPKLRRR